VPKMSAQQMSKLLSWPFTAFYWFIAVVNGIPGALGLLFPFGILGEFTPFYSPAYSEDVEELLVVHCARMNFALAVALALLFVLLRKESVQTRAKLLLVTCCATFVYAFGEMVFDTRSAIRLNLDLDGNTKYSKAVQFLIGGLHGDTPQTVTAIAGVGAVLAAFVLLSSVSPSSKSHSL